MKRLDEIKKEIEELEHLADVIEAGCRGEVIEFYDHTGVSPKTWRKLSHGMASYENDPYQYRIKPSTVPLDYNDDLLGRKVKGRYKDECRIITGAAAEMVSLGGLWVRYAELRANWQFIDGSPCEKDPSP